MNNIKDVKNKKNSKYGEYYINSKEGNDYTGDVGYLYLRIMFEGISKNYFGTFWLDIKCNILIKIYIPILTLIKIIKKNNIEDFFQMEEIYNSLPKEYKWWRIDKNEIGKISRVLRNRFKKICL